MPLPGRSSSGRGQPAQPGAVGGQPEHPSRSESRASGPRTVVTSTPPAPSCSATSATTRSLAVAVVASTGVPSGRAQQLADAPVVGPEVVAPVGDAVRLVDHQQAAAADQVGQLLVAERGLVSRSGETSSTSTSSAASRAATSSHSVALALEISTALIPPGRRPRPGRASAPAAARPAAWGRGPGGAAGRWTRSRPPTCPTPCAARPAPAGCARPARRPRRPALPEDRVGPAGELAQHRQGLVGEPGLDHCAAHAPDPRHRSDSAGPGGRTCGRPGRIVGDAASRQPRAQRVLVGHRALGLDGRGLRPGRADGSARRRLHRAPGLHRVGGQDRASRDGIVDRHPAHQEPIDAEAYAAAIEECRDRFPDLRVVSGVEAGEPHLFGASIAAHLAAGPVDRVLGSLHSLTDGDRLVGSAGCSPAAAPTPPCAATSPRWPGWCATATSSRCSRTWTSRAGTGPAGATGTPSGPSRPSTARCSGRWRRPGGRWRSTPPARWPRWSWCAGSATRAARRSASAATRTPRPRWASGSTWPSTSSRPRVPARARPVRLLAPVRQVLHR